MTESVATMPHRQTAAPLVVLAHGTASEAGRQVVFDLAAAAGAELGLDPRVGFVDVCEPTAAQVLVGTTGAVVVPLFIGGGYHVQVDVPEAAALGADTIVTPHLGADPALIDAAADRLVEAGWNPRPDCDADGATQPHSTQPDSTQPDSTQPHSSGAWTLVVAAAGSRRADVLAEIDAITAGLAARFQVAAQSAYLSAAEPRVADAVAAAVSQGRRVAVATILLAPGVFADRLVAEASAAGAEVVADPLGVHPRLVDAVVQRYRET